MARWLVVAILGLSACHSAAQSTTPVAKQPSMCEHLADHIVGLMSAAQKAKPEQLDPFRNVISKRCTEDRWSAEAQQCLNTITTLHDGEQCDKLLTEDQAKALDRDGQAAVSAVTGEQASPAAAAPMAAEPAAAPPPPPERDEAKSLRKAKKAKGAPGASSDPCEGGE